METNYIDLDKFVPEKLTMRINGEVYPVKDITVEDFLEILQMCELGLGNDEGITQLINQVRGFKKESWFSVLWNEFKRWARHGKPITDNEGKRKLARFLRKMIPKLPKAILKAMSQKQIQELLQWMIEIYQKGMNDPNFQKPMAGVKF